MVQPMTTMHPKLWMIILVTKQDLWWSERAAIADYYEHGLYNKSIEEITNKRGQVNFPHEYHAASLIMNNFRSGDGEVLAQTTQGYDRLSSMLIGKHSSMRSTFRRRGKTKHDVIHI